MRKNRFPTLDQFRKLARIYGVGHGCPPEMLKIGEQLEVALRMDGKHDEADEVRSVCTRLMGLKSPTSRTA